MNNSTRMKAMVAITFQDHTSVQEAFRETLTPEENKEFNIVARRGAKLSQAWTDTEPVVVNEERAKKAREAAKFVADTIVQHVEEMLKWSPRMVSFTEEAIGAPPGHIETLMQKKEGAS